MTLRTLRSKLKEFEAHNDPEMEKIERVDAVLDELTTVMIKNSEDLFNRGEKLDLLVKKA